MTEKLEKKRKPGDIINKGGCGEILEYNENSVLKRAKRTYHAEIDGKNVRSYSVIIPGCLKVMKSEIKIQRFLKEKVEKGELPDIFLLMDSVIEENDTSIIYPKMAMNLHEFLEERKDEEEIKNVFRDTLDITKKLHDAGFVHGDLYTRNIMIDHDMKKVRFIDLEALSKEEDSHTTIINEKSSIIEELFRYKSIKNNSKIKEALKKILGHDYEEFKSSKIYNTLDDFIRGFAVVNNTNWIDIYNRIIEELK